MPSATSTDQGRKNESPSVTVVDITDPTAAGESIEVLDQEVQNMGGITDVSIAVKCLVMAQMTRMTPWESCPQRLESTRCLEIQAASCSLQPAALNIRAIIRSSLSACMFIYWPRFLLDRINRMNMIKKD